MTPEYLPAERGILPPFRCWFWRAVDRGQCGQRPMLAVWLLGRLSWLLPARHAFGHGMPAPASCWHLAAPCRLCDRHGLDGEYPCRQLAKCPPPRPGNTLFGLTKGTGF